ncbi:MAG: hypothetical protein GX995_06205, partial [Clostridiales bacterium]|nr:hypothetical protein [Clostridiales bacterium]
MEDKKILAHLQNSINDAPINILDNIKNAKVVKMTEHDDITRQDLTAIDLSNDKLIDIEKAKEMKKSRTSNKKKVFGIFSQKALISFASVAAVFLLAFIGLWQLRIPDSHIYLDVNPSIQITTNRRDKVIKLNALNDEAKELIDDIKYKNKDYHDVTKKVIEALALESIVSSKYINDDKGVMLVSVYNNNSKKQKIQIEEINSQIRNQLDAYDLHPILLTQSIDKTNTIDKFSKEYGISAGKMTFIRNLILLNPELKTEDLVGLSLYELLEISAKTGIDIDQIVDSGNDERIPSIPEKESPSPSPQVTPTTEPQTSGSQEHNDDDHDDDDPETSESIEPSQTSKPTPTTKPTAKPTKAPQPTPISMDQAKKIALAKTNGGKIVDAEKDDDGFEITIIKGNIEYDIELNLYGNIIDIDSDLIDDDDNDDHDDNHDDDDNDDD